MSDIKKLDPTQSDTPAAQTLTMADCTNILIMTFDRLRAMKNEELLNGMVQIAMRYIDAIAPKTMDTETKQVLAIYEISEMLKRTQDFYLENPELLEDDQPKTISLQ